MGECFKWRGLNHGGLQLWAKDTFGELWAATENVTLKPFGANNGNEGKTVGMGRWGWGEGCLHHHLAPFSTLTYLFVFLHYRSFPGLYVDQHQLHLSGPRSYSDKISVLLRPIPHFLFLGGGRRGGSPTCVSVVIRDHTIQVPQSPSRHSLCT